MGMRSLCRSPAAMHSALPGRGSGVRLLFHHSAFGGDLSWFRPKRCLLGLAALSRKSTDDGLSWTFTPAGGTSGGAPAVTDLDPDGLSISGNVTARVVPSTPHPRRLGREGSPCRTPTGVRSARAPTEVGARCWVAR